MVLPIPCPSVACGRCTVQVQSVSMLTKLQERLTQQIWILVADQVEHGSRHFLQSSASAEVAVEPFAAAGNCQCILYVWLVADVSGPHSSAQISCPTANFSAGCKFQCKFPSCPCPTSVAILQLLSCELPMTLQEAQSITSTASTSGSKVPHCCLCNGGTLQNPGLSISVLTLQKLHDGSVICLEPT